MCDNDTLRAVIDERSFLGHQREIAHEHFLFLDFACFLVDQSDFYFQRSSVCYISLFTLFLLIFRSIGQ